MSPLEIEMLLHFHARADAYPWNGSPAESEALQRFRAEGLVMEPVNVDLVKLSERGRAYIRFITTLPLPVANWTIPGYSGPSLPEGMIP